MQLAAHFTRDCPLTPPQEHRFGLTGRSRNMRHLRIVTAILCGALIVVFASLSFGLEPSPSQSANRYRLDASQSTFIAHAHAGGLLWFKGHDHLVAVREFTGEAQLNPNAINQSPLVISAKRSEEHTSELQSRFG